MKSFAGTSLVITLSVFLVSCGSSPPTAAPASGPASSAAAASKPVASTAAKASLAQGSASSSAPASGAAALASSAAATASGQGAVMAVPFADNQVVSTAPVCIALDRGYFNAEGLDVQLISLNAIPQVIQAVASSQVAFATANPDPALFNALNRGLDIRLLASLVTNKPGDKIAAFLVRKDVIDSGRYKSLTDIKGMKVAAQAIQGQFYIDRMLEPTGLSIADLDIQNVALPDLITAFANKSIDAAWGTEPFNRTIEAKGLANAVAVTGDLYPGAVGVVLALSPGFAKSQPEASQRFVYAFLKGLRDYYHAFIAKDASAADKQAVIQALIQHTPVKDPNLYSVIGLPSVDPNGALDLSSWDAFQDYFMQRGLQQTKVDLKKYQDPSCIAGAVTRLGKT